MPKRKNNTSKVTWAHAFRDIGVASISKGQAPLFFVSVFVIIILWRLPEEMIGTLAETMVQKLLDGCLLGWILFIFALGAWAVHSKVMRRSFSKEAERIGLEKSKLQNKLADEPFRSSNRRKK